MSVSAPSSPPWPRSAHFRVGRQGERKAAAHLRSLGYEIRGLNVRLGRDEIDILAFDPADRVLVFCEVKSRSVNDPDYRPDLNLTPHKKAAMMRAARVWIADNHYEGGYRMDLLCIADNRVTDHMKELAWE